MSTIQEKIHAVRAAVVKRAPYCTGIVKIDDKNSRLFCKKQDDTSGYLTFTSATASQLQDLTDACLPATFGRDKEDVYDESYRKARKLDLDDFAAKFDPHAAGIVDIIREGLLEGLNQTRRIKVELYKLNVYDQGAFFKAHKDTPRSGSMFASLVVVFPTAHQGGKLLLRHDGEDSPSASFIAFFSDVEHEVTPVESGYRVTLTYNLSYEEPSTAEITSPDPCSVLYKIIPDVVPLQTAVTSLLQDERVLPQGGYFGFGLRFTYPAFGQKGSNLQLVLEQLKGSDALLKQVCDTLSLSTTLEVVFTEDC
ncbi:hypothetical protein BDN72DRAFT_870443 [Pluteus cervinus]|uniref:Uncharacterized protein n=1 Tax=Pluteus cervinus TaxID=181527 RepID=A0ACD3AWW0_9AGAR|nr:hypothetical protein BDN72DRAFT_870443 [Pluteus cervinus]